MILLVGPSGSGKTSLKEALVGKELCENVVTATSRPQREGETNGLHYHFFSKKQFKVLIDKGFFVEHVLYSGNYYGLLKTSIENSTELPKVAVLEIEGANYLKRTRKGVFIVHLDIVNNNICPKRKERDRRVDWSRLTADYTISSFEDIDINHLMAQYRAKTT